MSKLIARREFLSGSTLGLGLGLILSCSGCGSNPNEAENAETAAPGIPPENPNESVAERRSRTRNVPKQAQKIEDRNKAFGEKKKKAASK